MNFFVQQNFHFKFIEICRQKISAKKLVSLRLPSNSNLHTFQKVLSKWTKISLKKCRQMFFEHFSFRKFYFLESSDTYAKEIHQNRRNIFFCSDWKKNASVSDDFKKKMSKKKNFEIKNFGKNIFKSLFVFGGSVSKPHSLSDWIPLVNWLLGITGSQKSPSFRNSKWQILLNKNI